MDLRRRTLRDTDATRASEKRGRTRRLVDKAVTWLLVPLFVFPIASLDSSQSGLPDQHFQPSVWVAQQHDLSKFTVSDASVLLGVGETYHALSVDPDERIVWAVDKHGVQGLSFGGDIVQQGDIRIKKSNVVVKTDGLQGVNWLGTGRQLVRFDEDGQSTWQTDLDYRVIDVDIDPAGGRIWVATEKNVEVRDAQGQQPVTVGLENLSHLSAFEYDQSVDGVWVSGNFNRRDNDDRDHDSDNDSRDRDKAPRSLRLYSTAGDLLATVPVRNIRFLQATGNGYLWAASKKKLYRIYSASGSALFSVYPFDGRGVIRALAKSPRNDGVWLARNHAVKKIANDATVVKEFEVSNKINDIAVYTDTTAPTVSVVKPSEGVLLRADRPEIEVEYDDDAIGVDPSTLELFVNGAPLAASCSHSGDGAECLPDASLADGYLELSATVRDFSGNVSPEATVVFRIDTIPPQIVIQSPPNGTITGEEVIHVTGYVGEQAKVTINGAEAILSGLSFDHSVSLLEGDNVISIQAEDGAGNVSSTSVAVTRAVGDVTPPEIQAPPDVTLEAEGEVTSVALGSATAVDDEDGAVLALPDTTGPFPVGVTEIYWRATDTSGNTSEAVQRVTVTDTTPPVLVPPPHLTLEGSEPVTSELGEAQATDLFGLVQVINDAPSEFPVGSTVVTWKARDRNGNTAEATQTVTVLDEADVTRANGWQTPEPLEFDDAGYAEDAKIAMNDQGHAVALWSQEDESGVYNVMARYFHPDTGWAEVQSIENVDDNITYYDASTSTNITVDMNASGQALAIWMFEEEGHYYNTFTVDTGWGEAQPVADSGPTLIRYLQDVSSTSDGRFHTFWRTGTQGDGSANMVVKPYTHETAWGEATALESNDPDIKASLVSLAANNNGQALAIWRHYEIRFPGYPEYGSYNRGVYSSFYQAEEGWSAPESLGVNDPRLEAVLDESGQGFAVWLDFRANFPERPVGKSYDPEVGWGSVIELPKPDGEVESITNLDLNTGSGSTLYATWRSSESVSLGYDYSFVFSRSPDGGQTWSEPLTVFTHDDIERVIGEDNFVRMRAPVYTVGNRSGLLHALYNVEIEQLNERPRKPMLMSNVYQEGEGWSAPQIMSTEIEDTLISGGNVSKLRVDAEGNAVVAWEQATLSTTPERRHDLWTNHFLMPLPENIAATADAGADVTVEESGTITLNATRSADPDGFVYRYRWEQVSGPAVTIEDPTSPTIEIDAVPVVDADTVLTFRVAITDSRGVTTRDIVDVTVRNLGVHEDDIPPVVEAPRGAFEEATGTLTEVDLDYRGEATAFDNADGVIDPVPEPAGPFPLGVTTVTWRAVDAAGNVGFDTQTVSVQDTTRPELAIPDDISVESKVPIVLDIGTATTADTFGPVSITNDAPDIFPLGLTQVVWVATDQNGNTRTAVQNVSVSSKYWSDPVLLEVESDPAEAPSLDTDPNSNAVAAWYTNDGVNYRVMANRFSPDSGWGTAETVLLVSGQNHHISEVEIAAYGDGEAVLVWRGSRDSGLYVGYSTLDPDTGWSPPQDAYSGQIYDPVMSDGGGTVILAARHFPGSNVVAGTFTKDSGWSELFELDSDVYIPEIDVDVSSTGRGTVVWTNGTVEINLRHRDPESGWGEIASSSGLGDSGHSPAVSVDPQGVSYITWRQGAQYSSWGDPYASVYHPDGEIGDPMELDYHSVGTGDISVGADGSALAIWNNSNIFSSYLTSGAGWGDKERAEFYDGGIRRSLGLETDADGNAIVVYYHNTGNAIYANRYVPDRGWGVPEALAPDTGYFGNAPTLAIPPDGHAIAVWQQKDENGVESIWGNRLIDTQVPNQTPNAEAGTERAIPAGGSVTLSGSASNDPDGEILSASWSQVGGPAVALSNPDTLVADFAVPDTALGTELVFELIVTDDRGATDTDSVTLTIEEPDTIAPVVTPPADRVVEATGETTPVDLGVATATDNRDGMLVASPDRTGPFELGEHTITWTATDSSGNTGSAIQTIMIQDTTRPTLSVPNDIAVIETEATDLDHGSAEASDLFGPVEINNNAPADFPLGVTQVEWTATDANGNTSTAIQSVRIEAEITLTILSPQDGADVDNSSVVVSGTLVAPFNSGVSVNGHPTTIDRNYTPTRFHATVPLERGPNTISVVASSPSGEAAARTVDVTRPSSGESGLTVFAAPRRGPRPLEVSFTIDVEGQGNHSPETVYVADYDFDGDGHVDLSKSSFSQDGDVTTFEPVDFKSPVVHTYDTPGTYLAEVTINDLSGVDSRLDGSGTSLTIPIEVQSRNELDQMFRDIWRKLVEALESNDIEGAFEFISPVSRPRYEQIFSQLSPDMDSIVPQLGEIVQGQLIGDNTAMYVLRRGNKAFLIRFIRYEDGIWRIEGM